VAEVVRDLERWLPWAIVGLAVTSALVFLWFFPVAGDDAYHHSLLAVEQVRCWQHGVIWPRFHPDWNGGTGAFLPAIYSPVALTLDGLFLLISGEATRGLSISLVLALLATALLLRHQGREAPSPWWLSVLAPYLVLDILARATATEMWALAGVAGALPILLPSGTRAHRRWPLAFASGLLAVGSQPIMLILVAVPLAVAWLDGLRSGGVENGRGTAGWSLAIVLSTGIFWLPPLLLIGNFDRASIFGGAYGWRGHFATSLTGNAELGPVLLAVWVALGVIVVVAAAVTRRSMDPGLRGLIVFSAVSLFLAVPVSLPLWLLPGLGPVQFPWRFLGPATLAAVLILGRVPRRLRMMLVTILVLPLLLIPVEVDTGFPPLTATGSRHDLGTACAVRYGLAAILPLTPGEYARGFHPLTSLRELETQGAKVRHVSGGCRFPQVFTVAASKDGWIRLPFQWWPGLVVREGERRLRYENLNGLTAIRPGAGEHRIKVSLLPPWPRRIGALVSLAGLSLFGFLAVGRRGITGREVKV